MINKSEVLKAIEKSLTDYYDLLNLSQYENQDLSEYATKTYVNETVDNATPSYGPYSIRYNSENNRLEFIYTLSN